MNALLFLAVPFLVNAVEPAVRGTWEGSIDAGGFAVPFQLVVGERTCSIGGDAAPCSMEKGALTIIEEEGGQSRYQYTLKSGVLTLSGSGLIAPLVLHKAGAPHAAPELTAEIRGEPAAQAPAAAGRAPTGPAGWFDRPAWGMRLSVPAGWTANEKNEMVLMGSTTEAGLIVVRYFPQGTTEGMQQAYAAGWHEADVNADPAAPATAFRATSGTGLAGELAGTSGDGTALRIRTVGILTPFGGVLSVAGITTPEQYPTLKARTDAVAAQSTFKKPPTPPAVKAGALAGDYTFFYISTSGSYSREAHLTLCTSGRFTRRGEMAGSGEAGSAVASHGNSGRWTAAGGANAGTLTLTFDDGSTAAVPYQTSTNAADRSAYGAAVRFGADLYQKVGAGGC